MLVRARSSGQPRRLQQQQRQHGGQQQPWMHAGRQHAAGSSSARQRHARMSGQRFKTGGDKASSTFKGVTRHKRTLRWDAAVSLLPCGWGRQLAPVAARTRQQRQTAA